MNKIILRREKQVSPKVPGYTREGLRNLCRVFGIRQGRNTSDTLKNLKAAGISFTETI